MKQKTGFAFHVHHDVLLEYCTDYEERVQYIKGNKPAREQALRLRLFKFIPIDRLPPELDKAWEAYDKAREACDKAWEAYDKAREAYMPELIKLHEELCPNCPWDGKTIFSKKVVK